MANRGSSGKQSHLSILLFVLYIWGGSALIDWLNATMYRSANPHGVPAWAVSCFLAVGYVVAFAALFKSRFVKSLPAGISISITTPSDHPWIDQQQFERWDNELAAAGFVHLGDYSVDLRGQYPVRGFGRVMQHPELGCVAELGQLQVTSGRELPPICCVKSYFEDNWVLSTSNAKASASLWVVRRPRIIGSLHNATPPAQLLRIHQEHRRILMEKHSFREAPVDTIEQYVAYQRNHNADLRPLLARRSAISLFFTITFFRFRPRYEWWGELKRL